MSVSRETLVGLAKRHSLPEGAPERLARLLAALASEPDPPTTIRDPVSALDAHVGDALSGLEVPGLRAARAIADVGAGAGFPGLVLAIALPDAHIDLIEAASRKCEVIERLARAAGADNARAVPARAEAWAAAEGRSAYDTVTARAVAPLAVLVEYGAPLLREGGLLVAWKGARDQEEEAGAATAAEQLGLGVEEVRRVTPFAGARQRHLHVYRKLRQTPPKYPRRPGTARKRPLA